MRDQHADKTIGRAAAVRVGLIGCGRVGETCHLPAIRSMGSRATVVALADVDPHRRRRAAGMFDIQRTFADFDSMLRDAGDAIDVVVVCTPAHDHADAVVAALGAGKHVLVEKPLAVTLEDADRIAAAAHALPHLKVMVGFNLRHHRLVARARRLIASGAIGDVRLIRTIWTSGIRGRMQVPPWRSRRETGGSVLSEVAVHHIDLLRCLTGAEIEDVFAETQHGECDDECAALTLRLSTGATASCVFSERTADVNELELLGPRGRLAFSIYQFDSLSLTSPGQYGGRARRLVQTLKDVPEVLPILRRGGDFRETYRREWLAFLDAIRRDTPVPATIDDGREALRVVLAAGASASAGRPVAIKDSPSRPVPVQRAVEPDRPIIVNHEVDLSAIIATRGSFDAIRRTVRHLRGQSAVDRMELLIICTDAHELRLDPAEVAGFHSHRVIAVGPMHSVARANAAGVRTARAPLVVLCEDHAFPDPAWAEALIVAHRGPYAAVGPVVHNANPSGSISRADCLMGYGPWMEPKRPCEPEHLPGHNCSYKRQILLSYGDRLDEMLEAETVLHWDLRARGHRLYLDPTARLAHTNFARFGVWTSVQFHAGRVFAATRVSGWPTWKRLVFACGSPLIPFVRLRRLIGFGRRVKLSDFSVFRDTPTLLWGLVMDGLGQMLGYATGAGASRARTTEFEFERVRFIADEDRLNFERADAMTGSGDARKARA